MRWQLFTHSYAITMRYVHSLGLLWWEGGIFPICFIKFQQHDGVTFQHFSASCEISAWASCKQFIFQLHGGWHLLFYYQMEIINMSAIFMWYRKTVFLRLVSWKREVNNVHKNGECNVKKISFWITSLRTIPNGCCSLLVCVEFIHIHQLNSNKSQWYTYTVHNINFYKNAKVQIF